VKKWAHHRYDCEHEKDMYHLDFQGVDAREGDLRGLGVCRDGTRGEVTKWQVCEERTWSECEGVHVWRVDHHVWTEVGGVGAECSTGHQK